MTSEGQDNVLEIFASFNRYKFLMHEETTNVPYTAETCAKLLRIADIDEDETWAMGKTKVYNMHDLSHIFILSSVLIGLVGLFFIGIFEILAC